MNPSNLRNQEQAADAGTRSKLRDKNQVFKERPQGGLDIHEVTMGDISGSEQSKRSEKSALFQFDKALISNYSTVGKAATKSNGLSPRWLDHSPRKLTSSTMESA